MKSTKPQEDHGEIKFISLPTVPQIRNALHSNGMYSQTDYDSIQMDCVVRAYANAIHTIREAQRNAAVIAVQALRPEEFSRSAAQLREQVRFARMEHKQRMIDVFSETCTKGL